MKTPQQIQAAISTLSHVGRIMLRKMIDSSRSNGHDFGLVKDVVDDEATYGTRQCFCNVTDLLDIAVFGWTEGCTVQRDQFAFADGKEGQRSAYAEFAEAVLDARTLRLTKPTWRKKQMDGDDCYVCHIAPYVAVVKRHADRSREWTFCVKSGSQLIESGTRGKMSYAREASIAAIIRAESPELKERRLELMRVQANARTEEAATCAKGSTVDDIVAMDEQAAAEPITLKAKGWEVEADEAYDKKLRVTLPHMQPLCLDRFATLAKLFRAAMVLERDEKIRAFLMEHDPKALEQLGEATSAAAKELLS